MAENDLARQLRQRAEDRDVAASDSLLLEQAAARIEYLESHLAAPDGSEAAR